jgi:LuxR family maltose regulon positive regulatory protein
MLLARPVAPRLLAADWQGLLDDDDRRALESWGRRLAATAAGAPGPVGAPEGPAAAMPAASADARGAPAAGLSSREVEVLERIAAGDSNKLIARVFDLSPHTVKRHVANILDKLGAQSRGQAAAWYREHA